jgi:hypothetical protein
MLPFNLYIYSMKASLEHLPEYWRKEIEKAVQIIIETVQLRR